MHTINTPPNFFSNFSRPQNTSPQINNMTRMLFNLQHTVSNQQMLIQYLIRQQQQQIHYPAYTQLGLKGIQPPNYQISYGGFLASTERRELSNFPGMDTDCLDHSGNNFMPFKQEEEEEGLYSGSIVKKEASTETTISNQDICCKYEFCTKELENETNEAHYNRRTPFKIIRRNGFKQQTEQDHVEEAAWQQERRKSNKLIIPKHPPSKAKHLWINYGRKIIDFALEQTEGEGKTRIKQLVGKLGSKKDFKEVFGIKKTDPECDKAFKMMLGKLALFFIDKKAEEAFKESKYERQMITQKKVVSLLITKLITC